MAGKKEVYNNILKKNSVSTNHVSKKKKKKKEKTAYEKRMADRKKGIRSTKKRYEREKLTRGLYRKQSK